MRERHQKSTALFFSDAVLKEVLQKLDCQFTCTVNEDYKAGQEKIKRLKELQNMTNPVQKEQWELISIMRNLHPSHEAEGLLEKFLKIYPQDSIALYSFGLHHMSIHNYRQAVNYLLQSQEHTPDFLKHFTGSYVYDDLRISYNYLGETEKELETQEKLLEAFINFEDL